MFKFIILVLSLSFSFFNTPCMGAEMGSLDPKLAEKNLKMGEQFLATNKKKPGVHTLPTGLQYKIIKPGSGKTAAMDDFVKVHYRGSLIDGQVFDKSEREGAPSHFEVGATIPGFSQALQMMPPGSEWMIYIPAKLAYGPKGIPGKIPPNALLIFNIKLLEVLPAPDESMTGVLEELKEK